MKKKLPGIKTFAAFLLLILFCVETIGQAVVVPYRVGDKFGIADENGKIIIKPLFDYIEPDYESNQCFSAYSFTDSGVLSSLIYKNKIIISKQKYKTYRKYNGLFVAVEYKVKKNDRPDYAKEFSEKNHLYNADGLRVLNADYTYINIFYELDRDEKLNEVLFFTEDMNKKYSLHIYNNKLKKISTTFFSKTNYLEVDHSYERDYRDKSITFIYRDKNGSGRQLKISNNGKSLVKVFDKSFIIDVDEAGYGDEMDVTAGYYPERRYSPDKSKDSIILKIKKVAIKDTYYYVPKEPEEIKMEVKTFDINEEYIFWVGGKHGLKASRSDTFIIPAKYDEIIAGEIHPRHGGYILRNGDKYGLYIYNYPNNITIEPVFDKIPLMENVDYFKKDTPLLKLFGEDGKFFCYANHKGKLFYSPK